MHRISFRSDSPTNITRWISCAVSSLVVIAGCGSYESDVAPSQRCAASRLAASPRVVDGSVGGQSSTASDAVHPLGLVGKAIIISIDGLGAAYLADAFNLGRYPNLRALRQEGASTLNARTDCDYTVTLPNHTSMITGRPVGPDTTLPLRAYHGWDLDYWPTPDTTLHNSGNPNLSYVASLFDVAHDYGKRTCLYAGKSKFGLYATSYDADHGALDRVGVDDGCNKIDRALINDFDSEYLVTEAESDMAAELCEVVFFHFAELDNIGHTSGWGSEAWRQQLDEIDDWIGRLARFAATAHPSPWGLVLTADHGGYDGGHGDNTSVLVYRIPFFVVGPGYFPSSDIYTLVDGNRSDPGELQLRYSVSGQPVRNGDAANVALGMLGLPPVPGSLMRGLLVPQ